MIVITKRSSMSGKPVGLPRVLRILSETIPSASGCEEAKRSMNALAPKLRTDGFPVAS
jgi:hypothetical protein